ncbi:MAG TPA: hypothetical protein VNO70_01635 [Blastocatellia bacterium]|nr:hypothetical protein [Blastocatellia bacterium]
MIVVLEIGTGILMMAVGVVIAGLLLNIILMALSRYLAPVGSEAERADVIQFKSSAKTIKSGWSDAISL